MYGASFWHEPHLQKSRLFQTPVELWQWELLSIFSHSSPEYPTAHPSVDNRLKSFSLAATKCCSNFMIGDVTDMLAFGKLEIGPSRVWEAFSTAITVLPFKKSNLHNTWYYYYYYYVCKHLRIRLNFSLQAFVQRVQIRLVRSASTVRGAQFNKIGQF